MSAQIIIRAQGWARSPWNASHFSTSQFLKVGAHALFVCLTFNSGHVDFRL